MDIYHRNLSRPFLPCSVASVKLGQCVRRIGKQAHHSSLSVIQSIRTIWLFYWSCLSVCMLVVLSVCSWIVKHYNRTVYMFVVCSYICNFVFMCVCTVACLPCTVNTDNLFVMYLSVSIIQTIWLFFYWSCFIVKNYDRTVLYVFNCLLGVCRSVIQYK